MAAHVLDHGLLTASLRPLAAAAGTSDRMLIYHFGSKEGVVREIIEKLAVDMADDLDRALPATRFANGKELILEVMNMMRSPPCNRYLRVWFDIVAAAAQGSDLHKAAGMAVMDRYLDWVALRHPRGRDGAPECVAMIEGLLLFDAVGMSKTTDAILWKKPSVP